MNHLDLFAGIGGFSLAAQWMGWETVAQVEWDKWCQKVLAKNFPNSLRFGDIVEFNKMLQDGRILTNTSSMGCREGATKQREYGINETSNKFGDLCKTQSINIGHTDIITGGFPCQPFSHAGKRKGTDDSRYLWPEMLRTIRILKPSFVVGENVAGLVSMDNGKTLDAILSDLEDEGYQVESFIIPACSIGAWHRRDRIWIVAYSRSRKYCHRSEEIQRSSEGKGLEQQYSIHKSDKSGDLQKEFISDYNNQGLQGRTETGDIGGIGEERNQQSKRYGECDGRAYWQSEPSVGRVANGIPNRVDRLKGLGNAIVPQIAFQIFKAIESVDNFVENNTYR